MISDNYEQEKECKKCGSDQVFRGLRYELGNDQTADVVAVWLCGECTWEKEIESV